MALSRYLGAQVQIEAARKAIENVVAEGRNGENFRERAGTANTEIKLAVAATKKELALHLLDEGLAQLTQMPDVLEMLLVHASSRPMYRNQVKASLTALLDRQHWQHAASGKPELLESLRSFFKDCPEMQPVVDKIEKGVELPPAGLQENPLLPKAGSRSIASSDDDDAILTDVTHSVNAMRQVGFRSHTGTGYKITMSDEADAALKGFCRAVQRAENYFLAPLSTRSGPRDTTALEKYLPRLEADLSSILDFLVSNYKKKKSRRRMVAEAFVKFGNLCKAGTLSRFQAIADERSEPGAAKRLPWLSGPTTGGNADAHDDDDDDGSDFDLFRPSGNTGEKHKDVWAKHGQKRPHEVGAPDSNSNYVLRSAKVVRQPGDGSCLFHSMCYGLASGSSASSLRGEIVSFLKENPSLEVSGITLEQWILFDSNESVDEYTQRMAMNATWGGGIEMVAFTQLKRVNVHVYANALGICGSEFKRIACWDYPNATRTIHVLYQGGVHYDALEPMGP